MGWAGKRIIEGESLHATKALHCWGGRSLLLVRLLAMRAICASVRYGTMGVNIISLPPPSGYIDVHGCCSACSGTGESLMSC